MRDIETTVDAVIVGAGPAGIAAALPLLACGRRIVVLERGPEIAAKLPETFLPFSGLSPRLSHIVGQAASESKLPFDVCFIWPHARRQIRVEFVPDPDDPQEWIRIDRSRFDASLRRAFVEAGGEILFLHNVTAVQLPQDGGQHVRVTFAGPRGQAKLNTGIVIDASGKAAFVKVSLNLDDSGRTLDARVGLFTHLIVDAANRKTLPATVNIVPFENGFLYLIWIDDTRLSVGATLFGISRGGEPEFRQALNQVPWLETMISGARQVLPVIPVQNRAYQVRQLASSNYLLTGDAGGFMDPFFATVFALRSRPAKRPGPLPSPFCPAARRQFPGTSKRIAPRSIPLLEH